MDTIDKKPRTLKADLSKNLIDSPKPLNHAGVRKLAQIHAPRAIDRLAQEIDSKNPFIAVKVSQLLLDRGYGRPEQQVNVQQTVEVGLNKALTDLAKMMAADGVIEAQYVEAAPVEAISNMNGDTE